MPLLVGSNLASIRCSKFVHHIDILHICCKIKVNVRNLKFVSNFLFLQGANATKIDKWKIVLAMHVLKQEALDAYPCTQYNKSVKTHALSNHSLPSSLLLSVIVFLNKTKVHLIFLHKFYRIKLVPL